MKKKIVNTGGETLGIRFTLDERNLYGIKEGDVINIDEKMLLHKEPKICCLCGGEFYGYGNSAEPLMEGVCCDVCNYKQVLPTRLFNLKKETNNGIQNN